jgi:protein phosphatase
LDSVAGRGIDVDDLRGRVAARAADAVRFTEVYRRYCWPTEGLNGLRLAPFQILASDGANHATRDHGWHLDLADRLVAADPQLFAPTRRLVADLADPTAAEAVTNWWLEITNAGGEGAVVKPYDAAAGGRVQPGIKCRGREYLRIIYGLDYTEPDRLDRLRRRGLGRKRALAQREHALGLAALDTVAARGPLWKAHQFVFAILASESEPVDPRL